MSVSFARFANVLAATQRNVLTVGKAAAPAAHLAGLLVTAPMPVDGAIVTRYSIQQPGESYVFYTTGAPDVLEGDLLVASGITYRVTAVGPWPTDNGFLEIVAIRVKGG